MPTQTQCFSSKFTHPTQLYQEFNNEISHQFVKIRVELPESCLAKQEHSSADQANCFLSYFTQVQLCLLLMHHHTIYNLILPHFTDPSHLLAQLTPIHWATKFPCRKCLLPFPKPRITNPSETSELHYCSLLCKFFLKNDKIKSWKRRVVNSFFTF